MKDELVVKSIFHNKGSKLKADGNTVDIDCYTITAVGKDGYPKIKINSDLPFDGLKEKSVISIEIKKTQKSLQEFTGKEDESLPEETEEDGEEEGAD